MPKKKPYYVKCQQHGKQMTAVVCCHMIDAVDPVGFVENSSDPEDLQAWCEECERLFVSETEMTEAFVAFNDFAVVCRDCYHDLEKQHSRKRKNRAKNGRR
ncbi:MAG: hypothetical protein ACOYKN_11735 [Pirellula sp.]|jgi:hypothetical protein